MTTLQSSISGAISTKSANFDAKRWLKYFVDNRAVQGAIRLPEQIVLDEQLRDPLIKSLQKFQIGETGDGKHLRKFASRTANQDYMQCVDLFVKEEQTHGQVLAEVLRSLNATVLNWHWTDIAFIALRRLCGLKTELFIILIAEIIGKCFYKCVSDNINDEKLSNVFAVIVCDEIAHLRFHCEFLADHMDSFPWHLKYAIHYVWGMMFSTACFVFIADHKKALAALNVSSTDFIASCSKEFQRAARTAFGSNY